MTLQAPGVEIDVVDFSTSAVSAPGTVPLLVVATAANKIAGNSTSTVAAGTIPANANELTLLTSQLDLITMFGVPTFYQTASSTPLNAYELNEYGIQTAYSVLGITNQAYVLRADIDLSQLVGTTVRPTGTPANGTYWLNTNSSSFGVFVWNSTSQSFTNVNPTIITSVQYINSETQVPVSSFGTIGSYAINASNTAIPLYLFYKNSSNTWVNVGSVAWQDSFPTLVGSATPGTIPSSQSLTINGTNVPLNASPTVTTVAADINSAAITGITAAVSVAGALEIFVDNNATATISSVVYNGVIVLADSDSGAVLTALGLTAGTFLAPTTTYSSNTSVPMWLSGDAITESGGQFTAGPRPTGSVWIKMASVNGGLNFVMSKFSTTTNTFSPVSAPKYLSDAAAQVALDPVGGGVNIAQGTVFIKCAADNSSKNINFQPFYRVTAGQMTMTATAQSPVLTVGNSFTIQVTTPGSATLTSPITVTLTGTTLTSLVTQLLALNIPNFTAGISVGNQLQLTNTSGGDIILTPVTGNVLTTLGITLSTAYVHAYPYGGSGFVCSYWGAVPYVASPTAPSSNPVEGTYWYYSDPTAIDILINTGTAWAGYQTVTNDARGYDLSDTDPNGVQVVASAPTTQSTGAALVNGDLWIDSSDLEHFPLLYRYQSGQWVAIDLNDSTDSNGIVFADARWDGTGTTDPITGVLPSTVSLLTSNYTDLDCPLANLYPRGTLLFNTRRSGYNVKKFIPNYFNAQTFSGNLPSVTNAWVTAIGNRVNGSPYMGRKAVRGLVVAAMNSAVETNQDIRSQEFFYNLICAPGYTELAPQMVALNQDIGYQAFVVSECPMRLNTSATEIVAWSNSGTGETFQDEVLGVSDPYLAAWYSCGQTTDLNGNAIIMPPSYMALQGIIYSDSVSYEWFTPAGYSRGVVTNASAIGYVDYTTGDFITNSVNSGLQGTLYQNSINPIVRFPDAGILLWGNLTRNPSGTASALGSINIARLVSYLRYQLNKLSRPFLFQPNDQITRNQISTIAGQLLNTLITQRAISDYLVVCDTSNNTPDIIAARELYMSVAIVPVTDVEFIYIPLVIDQPGTSASLV